MIIISNIAALMAAPSLFITVNLAVQDAQENARLSYNNCLVDVHNVAIKSSTNVGQFSKNVKSECTEERKAYYDIIYQAEKADNIDDDEAKEYATEEADSVLQYIISEYAANFESKAELIKL